MSAKCTITAQSSVNCQQHQPVHKLWLLRLRLQPELQVLLAMAALCRGRDNFPLPGEEGSHGPEPAARL